MKNLPAFKQREKAKLINHGMVAVLAIASSITLLGLSAIQANAQGNIPTGAFLGEYYKDINFADLSFTRTDSDINFLWRRGSPDPSIEKNNFSVKWQGDFLFDEGRYEFATYADDGVRVFIDGDAVVDRWTDQVAAKHTGFKNISGGIHRVAVDYYEAFGGSKVHVTWAKVDPTPTPIPTATPTPKPIAVNGSTLTPTPTPGSSDNTELAGVGGVSELPKTGSSGFFGVGLLFLGSIGAYLYKRFRLI